MKLLQALDADWVNGMNESKRLTAKVWENLANPCSQELYFLKVLVNFLYAALSGGTLLISVLSQLYSTTVLSNGTGTQIHKI